MKMSCGEWLVKYILFFTNLVFALSGLTLLGLGIAIQLQVKEIVQISDVNFQVAPITAMVVGAGVFVIAFFGCCGAIRESNCMLVTYSIFMLLLMTINLTLAILIFTKMDVILAETPVWLNEAFNSNRVEFQEIERAFNCCGPNGSLSYLSLALPNSCCATAPCTQINAYSGCNDIVEAFFNDFGLAIALIAIVVAATELVSAVFGLCLANHARHKRRSVH